MRIPIRELKLKDTIATASLKDEQFVGICSRYQELLAKKLNDLELDN